MEDIENEQHLKGYIDIFHKLVGYIPVPFFILLVMDYLMKCLPHFRIMWQKRALTDLDFADDLELFTNKSRLMQLMTDWSQDQC